MDVSIIVPALNEEKYILSCLTSLKNQQTTFDYEIIVVDNNSTDRTAELSRDFGVQVISCQKKGIAFARNMGAEISKGEFLIFVDADTLLSDSYVQKSCEYLRANKNVVGLTGKMVLPNEKEYFKVIDKFESSFFKILDKVHRCRIVGSNAVIRRDIFFEVGGFPIVPSEDVAISSLLRSKGKITYFPEITAVTSPRRLDEDKYRILFYYLVRDVLTSIEMKYEFPEKSFRKQIFEKFKEKWNYLEIR